MGVSYPPFYFPSYMGIHDRQEHPPQVDSTFSFFFLQLQPGANSLNLPKTSALDNVKSQKSPRKRKEGEGGIDRYFSSSHKGLLVCVPPVDGWVSRLSCTAPLLSALLSCAAALRLRSTSVASSQASRKAPPSSSPNGGKHTH